MSVAWRPSLTGAAYAFVCLCSLSLFELLSRLFLSPAFGKLALSPCVCEVRLFGTFRRLIRLLLLAVKASYVGRFALFAGWLES